MYAEMFSGCPNLATSVNTILTAAAIPAGTYGTNSFTEMFYNCSALTGSAAVAVTNRVTAPTSDRNTFYNCISLSDYATLPANWK